VMAPGRLLRLRPRLVDLPAALWCLWPIQSSLANGLGLHDGLSAAFENFLTVGVPYLLGRAYCANLLALREIAIAIFLGAVVYIPLCLWEIRFSPQLHRTLYGFHQHSFGQTIRFGGYRPVVFMDHGLMVGMWMTAGCLLGFWLWRTRSLRVAFGLPVVGLLAALFCTAVLCKSVGAIILLAVGVLATLWTSQMRTRLALALLIIASPAYLSLRIAGPWDEEPVLEVARDVAGELRTESLHFRFRNEKLLLARALEKPVTGWGRWGRFLVTDPETGKSLTIPDGLWIVALGEYGLIGLVAITTTLLLPAFLFLLRFRAAEWNRPEVAPVAALALLLALYMIDNLANALVNPLYFIAAGGLTGLPPKRELQTYPLTSPAQIPSATLRSERSVSPRIHVS
jgi:hypothetical protein